jgi:hypothetical protein
MSERRFHKNLELWSFIHPKEAVMLPYVDCDHLQFCKTKLGEVNLKSKLDGKIRYVHAQSGAKKEAEAWFAKQDLNNIKVLYVYGVGLGHYYDAAKKWLKKSESHQLVFLEDDPCIVHRLLETEKGSEILKNTQVHLYFFHRIDDTEPTLNELYWNFYMTPLTFSALEFYAKTKLEKYNELSHKISYDAALKNSLLDEYLRFGYGFFRNFYTNLFLLPGSSLGNSLWGKFKNVPAIICGAGPSLQKNIGFLKNLQDRALIFAGSSALNAVTSGGVTPDFGAGLDPNPMQETRLSKIKDLSFPFLYRNRMYHPAMKLVKGPRLYVTGAGGYDVAEWFEKCLNIENEYIEEGRNVVNFCLEVAHMMGCNPIIFVGLDLAYTGMQAYSGGVVGDAGVNAAKLLQNENADDRAIIKEDIHGEPIYTLWKWVSESRWIGDFTAQHPNVTVINATEGGLGFPGVPNKTLKAVAKKYLTKKYQLRARVQKQIELGKLSQVTKKKVVKAMEQLRDSLRKCVGLLDSLIEESTALKKSNEEEIPTQTARMTLAEGDIVEEPGYQYVLDVFSAAASKMFNKDLRRIEKGGLSPRDRSLQYIDLHEKKYFFLRNTAEINANLIQEAIDGKVAFPKVD